MCTYFVHGCNQCLFLNSYITFLIDLNIFQIKQIVYLQIERVITQNMRIKRWTESFLG